MAPGSLAEVSLLSGREGDIDRSGCSVPPFGLLPSVSICAILRRMKFQDGTNASSFRNLLPDRAAHHIPVIPALVDGVREAGRAPLNGFGRRCLCAGWLRVLAADRTFLQSAVF
jgi:hypothetical protein